MTSLERGSGCGSIFGKSKAPGEVAAPDVIYGRADAMLDQQSYESAAKQYEEVDVNHPYSTEARRAIVMAAYSYYKAGKYDDAVSAADRYLTLHPGTPESDLSFALGQLRMGQQRWDEAAGYFTRLAGQGPPADSGDTAAAGRPGDIARTGACRGASGR